MKQRVRLVVGKKRCIKSTSSITLPLLGEWIIDRTKKLAMIDLIKY